MKIRRIVGKSLVFAAIYAFALQTVLATALAAAHAVSGPSLPPSILCSGAELGNGAGAPAGNGDRFHGWTHCVMPGCGGQAAGGLIEGARPPQTFALVIARFVADAEGPRANPIAPGRRLARAPPQA